MSPRLRVVVAECDVLPREGVVWLLTEAGLDVVGRPGDAEDFLGNALAHRRDVAVVDGQMRAGHGADGLGAALTYVRGCR